MGLKSVSASEDVIGDLECDGEIYIQFYIQYIVSALLKGSEGRFAKGNAVVRRWTAVLEVVGSNPARAKQN